MILLRREPAGPHLPKTTWDRAILAPEAMPMRAYHAWTLRQLAWTVPREDRKPRYELRPIPPEAMR